MKPLNAAASLAALEARKPQLERFHEVVFAEGALKSAVEQADLYLQGKLQPGKGLELLDAAGAAAKVHGPGEALALSEAKKKLASIAQRVADAIANHEFGNLRAYSDEERKERETLAALEKKYGADAGPAPRIDRLEVKKIIAKWNAYPYRQ